MRSRIPQGNNKYWIKNCFVFGNNFVFQQKWQNMEADPKCHLRIWGTKYVNINIDTLPII